MTIFKDYAKYYDVIYRDKDYGAEIIYILKQIKKHGFNGQLIADLGCGSGRHAIELAKQGYQVDGFDISDSMIQLARKNLIALSGIENLIKFTKCDIRNFSCEDTLDATLALFHVISYQVTNKDLVSTFQSVKNNLRRGGLLFFDFWHGTGVLTDPPVETERNFQEGDIFLTRRSTPEFNFDKCTVTVNITMTINNKSDGKILDSFKESHTMRYLFLPELIDYLQQAGLEYIASYKWLTDNELDDKSWYGCCIAKAR